MRTDFKSKNLSEPENSIFSFCLNVGCAICFALIKSSLSCKILNDCIDNDCIDNGGRDMDSLLKYFHSEEH